MPLIDTGWATVGWSTIAIRMSLSVIEVLKLGVANCALARLAEVIFACLVLVVYPVVVVAMLLH